METFAERLARLVRESGISDAAVADCLGVSEAQAKRIKEGTTQSLKFLPALRLCRKMNVSPWELAGEDPMLPTSADVSDDLAQTVSRLAADLGHIAHNQDSGAEQIQQLLSRVSALEEASAKRSRKRSA